MDKSPYTEIKGRNENYHWKIEMDHCPDCLKLGNSVVVQRFQLEDDKYIILCQDDSCSFHKVCYGRAQVNKEDLVYYGFPEELLQHMEIYREDLDKLVRMTLYEYCTNSLYPSNILNIDVMMKVEACLDHLRPADVRSLCGSQLNYTKMLKRFRDGLDDSVSDITPEYSQRVKCALLKVKNYKFPDDFISLLLGNKLPLLMDCSNIFTDDQFEPNKTNDEQIEGDKIDKHQI